MRTFSGVRKVWIDALTSKQGTLLGTLARELLDRGVEVLVTCREYEYTCRVLDSLGIPYVSVGKYSEGSPHSKVYEDGLRAASLVRLVQEFMPEYLIAYPNPSASRVAFGVGIKYIALTDSPHAVVPSRLSLPLADYVVFSKCIPEEDIRVFTSGRFTKLLTYNGVDELGWVKRLEPREEEVRALGLEPWSYVVFRPAEELATYYRGANLVSARDILEILIKLGYDVVFLPRYSSHRELGGRGVIVLEKGFSGPSITYFARLVVTGGASIAREAALLGTPSVTYTPLELYVNSCVEKWGFPLRRACSLPEIKSLLKELADFPVQNRDAYRERAIAMEDPVTVVVELITGERVAGGNVSSITCRG